jgi:hypothetical protein
MVSNDFVLSSATGRLTICSMGGAYLVVPNVSLWLMAGSIWTDRASKQVLREHLSTGGEFRMSCDIVVTLSAG